MKRATLALGLRWHRLKLRRLRARLRSSAPSALPLWPDFYDHITKATQQ